MRYALLVMLIVAQTLAFGLLEGSNFASAGGAPIYFATYLQNALMRQAPLLILAAAVALTMSRDRGVDCSSGSIAMIAAYAMLRLADASTFYYLALPAGLGAAIACGLVNATLIRRLNAAPLLITLATMVALYCAALSLPMRVDLLSPYRISGLPSLRRAEVIGPIAAGLFVTLILLKHYTPVMRHVLWLYGLSALIAGLAAVVHIAAEAELKPNVLLGYQMAAVVAALLGGARFQNGGGSMITALLAAINLTILYEGMISVEVHLGQAMPIEAQHAAWTATAVVGLIVVAIHFAIDHRKAKKTG